MRSFLVNLKERSFTPKEIEEIKNSKSVLIQLFCGDIDNLKRYVDELRVFKNAYIIGSTTDGEIENSKVLVNSCVVIVSIFENTSLKTAYVNENNEYQTGKKLIKELLEDNTKAIISFCKGLGFNAESFLKGVSEVLPEGILFGGGLAGDNANFVTTYIVFQDKIYDKGAVGVSLNSDILKVENFYNFGWKGIGIEHTITKSKRNVVYEIDNMPITKFYSKYLGKEIEKQLPKTGIIYPLMIESDGKEIARAVVKKNDDGSLVFAGEIKEGERVKIGIGKGELITNLKAKFSFTPESFYIYSCMARRRFAQELISKEIAPFANIAPTGGFFTYGEFFTFNKPIFFNQTMTVLALSEKDSKEVLLEVDRRDDDLDNKKALLNLIEATAKDYEKVNNLLKFELINESKYLKLIEEKYLKLISMMNEGVLILDENFEIIKFNRAFLEMLNSSIEVGGKVDKYLIDFSKNFNSGKKSFETKLFNNKEVLVNISKIDGSYLVTVSDLSEIKEKDRQLFEQSKLAQMGEMINMIAHQWRQPINTLSVIGIELEMKSSLNILTNEEIEHQAKEIQNIVQDMSKIIDDFLSFGKNGEKIVEFSIKEVIGDVLRLIGPQLVTHNVNLDISIEKDEVLNSYKSDVMHILLNLLSNALYVLDERKQNNKKILIKSYKRDGCICIDIEDNAGGIDEKIIDRIFEPYFTTKGKRGTGLGLYMSKRMANRLYGDLEVCNVDDGAKFTLKIPIKEKDA